jgi:hypothetical protein
VPPLPLSAVLVDVVVVVLDEELVVEVEVVLLVGAAPPVVTVLVVVSPPQAAIPAPAPSPSAIAAAMGVTRFIALLPVAYRGAHPTQAPGSTGRGGFTRCRAGR